MLPVLLTGTLEVRDKKRGLVYHCWEEGSSRGLLCKLVLECGLLMDRLWRKQVWKRTERQ
jgi:hypothetical protein